MKRIYALCAAFFLLFCTIGFLRGSTALASVAAAPVQPAPLPQAAEQEGCLTCHVGIESIRPAESAMLKDIKARGECTVCHGGDPAVTDDADAAHTGAPASVPFADFIPDPGSMAVANQTCGQCHENYADALERSLMNTQAGTIQGNLWSWGVAEDQAAHYGNYAVEGSQLLFGSFFYKDYMLQLANAYPDQFPTALELAPNPTVEEIQAHPALAAFTYQRQQCQQCHLGVTGNQARGEYRGLGCSSCHIPYSAAGFYEGGDPTIPKDEPGHSLVHEIQGTREARNGIPTESCTACHNQSKRTGTSYQGLMETPYRGPSVTATGRRKSMAARSRLITVTATDWIASSNATLPDGSHELLQSPGSVTQSPAYLRWETPILGVNGEGRVSPLIPSCQTVFTVIGPDGKPLTTNAIGRTPPSTEGGDDAGAAPYIWSPGAYL